MSENTTDDRIARALKELREAETSEATSPYATSRIIRARMILEGRKVPYTETVYR